MILISNKQRDDIVRYLEQLHGRLQGNDLRTINARRLVGILIRRLREKRPQ
jgi:hypothetical protein